MVFESIKDMLKGIYSDVKKDMQYVIWFGFRMSDDEIFAIQNASVFKLSMLITSGSSKAYKAL